MQEITARVVGETSVLLGAGREKKGDPIDYSVGIEIYHKVGDRVEAGEPLFAIHANKQAVLNESRNRLLEAHRWSEASVPPLPLFYGVVR